MEVAALQPLWHGPTGQVRDQLRHGVTVRSHYFEEVSSSLMRKRRFESESRRRSRAKRQLDFLSTHYHVTRLNT